MNPEQMGRSSGQDRKVLQVNQDAMCKLNPEGFQIYDEVIKLYFAKYI